MMCRGIENYNSSDPVHMDVKQLFQFILAVPSILLTTANNIISPVQSEYTNSNGNLGESLPLVSIPIDAPAKQRSRDRYRDR